MSAIAALWYRRHHRDAEADIERMLSALALYGPDRTGHWRDADVALGHCLRVMLPEDRHDRQPITGNRVTLVATARLDNRAELAEKLGLEPTRACNMADSEFVLAAYERWGDDCPNQLLGDFSFAVWDKTRQCLFCARDHLGRHPLVYFSSDKLFALASMPKGLFALPDVPRRLDEDEVIRRLRVAPLHEIVPRERHIFAGLRTLPAGHCLTVTANGETISRYWAPDPERRLRLSDADTTEAFRALFDEAVRCRLRGVGDVGSHLSGGLDSAAVTVTAARLLAGEGRGLTAFTAAPRSGYAAEGAAAWPLDESHAAGLTAARHANITHVVMRPDGTTTLDAIRRSLVLADRTPVNPCYAVWDQQICAEAKRRGVHVLLTGLSGNMTISYNGYARLAALLRQGKWITLGRELMLLPRSARTQLLSLLRPFIPPRVWEGLRRIMRPARPRHTALHPDLLAQFEQQEQEDRQAHLRLAGDGFALRSGALFRVDLGPFLAATLAGWGIDSRDPTADRRIVEFCLSLPEDQYLRHGIARRLVRQAFANRLPPEVLGQMQRGMQAPDFHEGVEKSRDELMAELDSMANSPIARRCLDLPWLRQMVKNWPKDKDGWRNAERVDEYRLALLRGVAMGRFILDIEGGNA
jgi:asparagine synthase (glutamine-hydrolysing)